MNEPDDPLAPARGVLLGALLGALLWVAIALSCSQAYAEIPQPIAETQEAA